MLKIIHLLVSTKVTLISLSIGSSIKVGSVINSHGSSFLASLIKVTPFTLQFLK